jgi:predicted nuclease of predicted toxin-antitoxin system
VTIWIDAQRSPAIASWFHEKLAVAAVGVRDLGLRDATDEAIFQAAREANAIVLTKDSDFVQLLERRGSPPRVVWLTCGNTSNLALTEILQRSWPTTRGCSRQGKSLVEISDAPLDR